MSPFWETPEGCGLPAATSQVGQEPFFDTVRSWMRFPDQTLMSPITDIANAKPLFTLYARARANADAVSDNEVLSEIQKAYWATNAAAAVSQILAIIGPACLLRPHLTETLIRAPIEALIACGEGEPASLLRAGEFLLSRRDPYISPDEYGTRWLKDVLPALQPMADRIFPDVLRGCLG
jgi:hypothetical protein